MPKEPDKVLEPTLVFKPWLSTSDWANVEIKLTPDPLWDQHFNLTAWQERFIADWFGEDANDILEFIRRFGGSE